MKYLFTILFAWATALSVNGQQLFQANSKSRHFYADIKNNDATLYTMGRYLDKAGTGYSIIRTDTLQRQADGSYASEASRIIREKNEWYMVPAAGKNRQFRLDTVLQQNVANAQLNNAWFLDRYFAMSEQLNKTYPLNHHSFREAFPSWNLLPAATKEMDYIVFRAIADNHLKETADSISLQQDKYTRLTNYMIEHIREIDYTTLKDSLVLLPAVFSGESGYYSKVMNTIVVSKPAYFLQLAEDFPSQQSLIFSSVVDNKQARSSVESVAGHDISKKTLLKEQRSHKLLPYTAIGIAAVGAGLIALIIVAL